MQITFCHSRIGLGSDSSADSHENDDEELTMDKSKPDVLHCRVDTKATCTGVPGACSDLCNRLKEERKEIAAAASATKH